MWEHNEDEAVRGSQEADFVASSADASDNSVDAGFTENDFTDTDVLEAEDDRDDDLDDDLDDDRDDEAYMGNGPVDDFVGDSSVVFDVDDLVAEFEAEGLEDSRASSRLRRRLEAIAERKRRHDDLLDFADYDLDA